MGNRKMTKAKATYKAIVEFFLPKIIAKELIVEDKYGFSNGGILTTVHCFDKATGKVIKGKRFTIHPGGKIYYLGLFTKEEIRAIVKRGEEIFTASLKN